MKIINDEILKKQIVPVDEYLKWVEETFLLKNESILPAKISMKPKEDVFFNVMPSIIKKFNVMGNKIVNRIPGNNPLMRSEIFLYDLSSGELKNILEGNYITTLRTGAVAAYSALLFINKLEEYEIGIIGLGNVTTMTFNFLFEKLKDKKLKVKLYEYKDQHLKFKVKFERYKNIEFIYCGTYKEVIKNSDLIVSGVSYTNDNFGKEEWFKSGVVVIPIHTRGFQNLDRVVDKVIVDDKNHVKNFKYFNEFKKCIELSEILISKNFGREKKEERILIYNIGISLLDIIFSLKFLEKIGEKK